MIAEGISNPSIFSRDHSTQGGRNSQRHSSTVHAKAVSQVDPHRVFVLLSCEAIIDKLGWDLADHRKLVQCSANGSVACSVVVGHFGVSQLASSLCIGLAVVERGMLVLGTDSCDEDLLARLGSHDGRIASRMIADDEANLVSIPKRGSGDANPVAVLLVVHKGGPGLHPRDKLMEGVRRVRTSGENKIVALNTDDSLRISDFRDVSGFELSTLHPVDVGDLLTEAELDVQRSALLVEIFDELAR
jgi:hypothetical protein